jgi:hypothetical protein
MTTIAVHYMKKAPALRPAKGCQHGGSDALVIGSRIEKVGRRNRITCDAMLCMSCGTIRPIAGTYRHYHDALSDFWREFGWNRELGMRIAELADLSTGTRFESYMALATGMSPKDLRAYLKNRGETAPKENEPTAGPKRRRKPRARR